MSYIQIEIGGKLRGLKFNTGTNILLRSKVKDYSDDEKEAFGAYCVIWAALVCNCKIKNEPVDFTFEDVCEWADALKNDVYIQLIKMQSEANEYRKNIEEESDERTEEEKKKMTEITQSTVTELPVES